MSKIMTYCSPKGKQNHTAILVTMMNKSGSSTKYWPINELIITWNYKLNGHWETPHGNQLIPVEIRSFRYISRSQWSNTSPRLAATRAR